MASVFVSHSSQDRAVTEHVVAQLRAAGFAALFVDFDPEEGIPAGRYWERELYAQLRRTDAVVFLASEASVASRWCFAELSLARSLGWQVFPLRLQPGVGADTLTMNCGPWTAAPQAMIAPETSRRRPGRRR